MGLQTAALSVDELKKIDLYWKAANYLSLGQIYLLDNPLLKTHLKPEHIKPRLLGHWGTTPGLNFLYVHLNRLIKMKDLNMIFLAGPGHGGPALVANTYLEGTYSEIYSDITQDQEGLKKLFRQFSFPGGIPSHAAPETPGSIHEGGELGYVLSHGFGAVFDNPDLIAVCVVGDGEAESGPLAASWQSNKFLNPITDGAVLPILHLNGYKIANPTVLARISHEELESYFEGLGYHPYLVEGDDPEKMHEQMAQTLEEAIERIRQIQSEARNENKAFRPLWPMIIFKSPKGWTAPKECEGKKIEGYWRAHQVPLPDVKTDATQLKALQEWFLSYHPQEIFDEKGKIHRSILELAPKKERRMGANPHANGGLLLRDLRMPDFRDFALKIKKPGTTFAESASVLGDFLKEVMRLNLEEKNFRVMGPDETASNHLQALFDVTGRSFMGKIYPYDDHLAVDGRVMEILSEHTCQGWLEGYLLTGRHGFFSCYEGFIHIVDSMFNQFAKWLKVSKQISWRRPIASLNYFLTSHVWRQDHNGFSHQDPGFIDHVVNKKASIIRVYLAPDANTLLSVADHCLRSRNYVNVIIAGKHSALQYLPMDQAIQHTKQGLGIWAWASNDFPNEPDIIMACAGDIPTLETLAAVSILRELIPDIKIRVINVIDLMVLQPATEHPHGLADKEYDDFFPPNTPVVFAFHGYPWLIHRLTYHRANHDNLHVRGYKEEGTTTTPFDMCVLNDIDRFHLVIDAVDRIPRFAHMRGNIRDAMGKKLIDHKEYIHRYGDDLPEIKNWKWSV